jgi:hypothetical protein
MGLTRATRLARQMLYHWLEPFSAHYDTGKSRGLTRQSDAVVGKMKQLFSRASAAGAHSTGNQKNVTKNKLTNYDTQR